MAAQRVNEPEQNAEPAAKLGQNDERQKRAGDTRRLHVLHGSGITENLAPARLDEDDRKQHAANQDEIRRRPFHLNPSAVIAESRASLATPRLEANAFRQSPAALNSG